MNRAALTLGIVLIVAVVVVVVAVGLGIFIKQNQVNPYSTPPVLYHSNFTVLNPQVTEVAGYNGFFNNVSQGLKLQVKITFTAIGDQALTLPMENLKVTYYSSNVDPHTWIDGNGNYSLLQQQAFDYQFSPSVVVVQPEMSNSTILTLDVAQDAPTGQYSFEINIENGTIGLEIIVTPKGT